MSLKSISFKLAYNSRDDDVVKDFYTPCFQQSMRYERAVGYFTSNILKALSEGLHYFVAHEGTMKLLCSPRFTGEDITAIIQGYEKRSDVIERCLRREVDAIPVGITSSGLNFLSWLIAHDRLEIKIAVPTHFDKEEYGIYHEKIGLFFDYDGNSIAFYGSNNETLSGVFYNYESFDVYCSWSETDRCRLKTEHFARMWDSKAKGLEIYSFPQAIAEQLIEKVKPECKPADKSFLGQDLITRKQTPTEVFINGLWKFQKEAIDAFRKNDNHGLFSMATGTGKTKTAIGALLQLIDERKRLLVVIASPQNTISAQWQTELDSINRFQHAVVADGNNPMWPQQVADKVLDFNSDNIQTCVVYTTYNTLSMAKFVNALSRARGETFLICDEVHWAGADMFSKGLIDSYKYRLGLSATPQRHMDDVGTDMIINYFGEVVYEFSLERALTEINPSTGETFLCPYTYHPIFVSLNSAELAEYNEITKKISRQYAKERQYKQRSAKFQRLCEERQRIIVNADAKYQSFINLIKTLEPVQHSLIYCSPEQIDRAQDIINDQSVVNHRFTGKEGTNLSPEFSGQSERDFILSNFEQGKYRALVAMKCLDEGINIPNARVGILLASSGNPKQYIQRRGRLLRRCPGKKIVKVYDFIVIPLDDKQESDRITDIERQILEKEFVRYDEFAGLANNRMEATNIIFEVKQKFGFFDVGRGK